jgi:aryl-alcohol dehydrogenase-like predicted oxidoreductase
MIATQEFGSTGFFSSRVIFGAAALAGMKPARVEATLALLERFGINHIDTAAAYGESERNLAGWLSSHRRQVFLATKTGERKGAAARASLERSLERMNVDSVDSIQLHNLVDEPGWQTAMGRGGALEALIRAREEGLVRFLGVTGHGTWAPAMHLRSLEVFEFASVLCPYSHAMMAQPDYAADFDALEQVCRDRGVALQTIKAVARRRWSGPGDRRYSWYEPLNESEALRHAVHWVLGRPGLFLNSSSDGRLLEATLEAAAVPGPRPSDAEMEADASRLGIAPLFVRDVNDAI